MKKTKSIDLDALPGHYIRRLQQIAVAVFLQETEAHGVTPVQYAALNQVARTPNVDQRSLARAIGFDTSTIASVIDRLEARGLMQRHSSPDDKRVRLLALTAAGAEVVEAIGPDILKAQERMLHPLTKAERAEFMRMLRSVVDANNELSRAPSDG
jgi:MarR family transcriptional regulator, lower aerobic nicotinate degradation pathway regulator